LLRRLLVAASGRFLLARSSTKVVFDMIGGIQAELFGQENDQASGCCRKKDALWHECPILGRVLCGGITDLH
jgi:hypothetical protein